MHFWRHLFPETKIHTHIYFLNYFSLLLIWCIPNINRFMLCAQEEKKMCIRKWRYIELGRKMNEKLHHAKASYYWKNILIRILGYIIVPNTWNSWVFCHLRASIHLTSSFKVCGLFHNPTIYNSNNIITITAYTSQVTETRH